MKVSGNQFSSNALKNLIMPKKKDPETRQEKMNVEAQQHIEKMKQMVADEARYQKNMEADRIAKKIARGEYVTNEEREQVRGIDEDKLRKADEANNRRKQISAQLANATTKEQARTILLDAKLSAGEIIEKGDEQYGELLMEAVNKAEADHYGSKQTASDTSSAVKVTPSNVKQEHLIDIRL